MHVVQKSKWTQAITQAITFITVWFILRIWGYNNTISLCGVAVCVISVWIFVWFISIWRGICTARSQGNRKGLIADAPSGSGVRYLTPRSLWWTVSVTQPLLWMFALAYWLRSMQMKSMYSRAERCSTSIQSLHGTAVDPIYVFKFLFKLWSSFKHANWILTWSPELIGLKWYEA